ncbi:EAL domain-containing protein [Marinobacterium sediminicola]|uniref:Diguanylate cyclase (GGDEF) domain-containing protein n=1 Tax=Marinobacterium sediminicola TaxID=518898 RepID=A0ABY1S189_9GAMM|nr:EAL domain-containing protein [Marinobacterium sediminicola]ULG69739.1 EAL domain-containing protein [Marinobacterium sediminicola]SMR75451.1 diguanylate cyclase (GGDEF) domain-containing protein [Marinobacterium sediminicola]
MSGSSDEIISALARSAQQDSPRRNINILFAHCNSTQTDQILNQLRTARFAPRGEAVTSLSGLQEALGKRTWDLLIMAENEHHADELTPTHTVALLHHLDRDLPVLLLLPGQDYPDPTPWLRDGIQAVIPEANSALLLLTVQQLFDALNTRRELLQAQIQLSHLNSYSQRLVQHSSLAICYVHNGLIRYANDSFAHLFGHESGERMHDHSLRQLMQPQYREDLDMILHESIQDGSRVQRSLGSERPDQTRFDALFTIDHTEFQGQPCLSVEVTTSLDSSEQIFKEVHPLSGLRNQTAFLQALDSACHNAHRGGQDRSLVLVTLDHLDVIRSEVGTEGIELILRDISTILKQQVSRAHLVSHLDDDTFAILMHNADPDIALALSNTLCRSVSTHVCKVQKTAIHTTVSIGVVMINDSAPSPQQLLQRARLAAESLHHGNRPGNGVSLYQSEQALLPSIDTRMSKRLLNALKLDRFRLLFQPVVPLRLNSQSQYYEVLLRLISDSERALSPNTFIAQAIDPEVLIELDRWVISTALEKLSEAFLKGDRVHLLINLSGPSMRSAELLEWLSDKLRLSRVPAEYLVFQISESDAAVDLMEVRSFTQALQQLNCQVCLKHFGSSPNSEHVLRELDSKFIKLDGSYIQDLKDRTIKLDAIRAMLEPLHARHKLIIAPLVEHTSVISDLYTAGVHLIQGYYLQQPREQMDYDFFAGDSH